MDQEDFNPIVLIPLTRGKMAVIDAADYDLVGRYTWSAITDGTNWYASTNTPRNKGKQRSISMHRLIMGVTATSLPRVDHRDRDGLNNRRLNLRFATQSQNLANSERRRAKSGYRGVKPITKPGRIKIWQANIRVHPRSIYLGAFATAEEAARAYDARAQKEFGEFARLNFPEDVR